MPVLDWTDEGPEVSIARALCGELRVETVGHLLERVPEIPKDHYADVDGHTELYSYTFILPGGRMSPRISLCASKESAKEKAELALLNTLHEDIRILTHKCGYCRHFGVSTPQQDGICGHPGKGRPYMLFRNNCPDWMER